MTRRAILLAASFIQAWVLPGLPGIARGLNGDDPCEPPKAPLPLCDRMFQEFTGGAAQGAALEFEPGLIKRTCGLSKEIRDTCRRAYGQVVASKEDIDGKNWKAWVGPSENLIGVTRQEDRRVDPVHEAMRRPCHLDEHLQLRTMAADLFILTPLAYRDRQLSSALVEAHKIDEAYEFYKKAKPIFPEDHVLETTHSKILYYRGQFGAAEKAASMALSFNPAYWEAWAFRGAAKLNLGESHAHSALADANKALSIEGRSQFALAVKERAERIIKGFKVGRVPGDPFENRQDNMEADPGRSLAAMHESAARALLLRLGGGAPGPADRQVQRIVGLIRLGNLGGARAAADQMISESPTDHRGFLLRSKIRNLQGDLDGAIEDATKAIELKPTAEAYYARAGAYNKKGDKEAMKADLAKAKALVPKDAKSLLLSAMEAESLGEYVRALEYFKKAAALDPQYKAALEEAWAREVARQKASGRGVSGAGARPAWRRLLDSVLGFGGWLGSLSRPVAAGGLSFLALVLVFVFLFPKQAYGAAGPLLRFLALFGRRRTEEAQDVDIPPPPTYVAGPRAPSSKEPAVAGVSEQDKAAADEIAKALQEISTLVTPSPDLPSPPDAVPEAPGTPVPGSRGPGRRAQGSPVPPDMEVFVPIPLAGVPSEPGGAQSHEAWAEEGKVVGGRYVLEERVGVEGGSWFYLGRDQVLDRVFLLQKVPPAFEAGTPDGSKLLSGARLAANLDHPAILAPWDLVEEEGRYYLVFEHVEGSTLEDMLAGGKRLPLNECKRLLSSVAEALDHAHAHGVFHGDLGPSHVMVPAEGPALLEGFCTAGLIRAVWAGPKKGAGGSREADLEALGRLVQKMIPGPGIRGGAGAFRGLEAVAARATHPDASARFKSAREFLSALSSVPDQ